MFNPVGGPACKLLDELCFKIVRRKEPGPSRLETTYKCGEERYVEFD